jgi:hypothetical protein
MVSMSNHLTDNRQLTTANGLARLDAQLRICKNRRRLGVALYEA